MAADDQHPRGSGFGPRSTPDDVLAGVDLMDRTAVVTGGASGIGLETVRALVRRGARVLVPARRPDHAAAVLAEEAVGGVAVVPLDLADLASVRRGATAIAEQVDAVDLLILNAGVMACPEQRVGPGWERQLATNHLGHMALTHALLPRVLAASAPRVVVLSSVAHRRGGIRWDDPHLSGGRYDKWVAYAQSKTANALFAVALSPQLAVVGGVAVSVHPGGILTPLQRHLPVEEQVQLGWLAEDGTPNPAVQALFKTPAQGCATTLWAATSPLLADAHGAYCEDCDVAELVTDATPRHRGVAAHAVDSASAERLWAMSERMLADA